MAYRLLMVSSDNFPVMRVDVDILFGAEVASRGYTVDLIAQSEAACDRSYRAAWAGGEAYVAATDLGQSLWRRVRKHFLSIAADLRLIPWMRSGRYDLLIVKDKFLSGVVGLFAAWAYGRPFVYWLSFPFPEAYLERARDGTARYPLLYWVRGHAFRVLLYWLLLPRADHIFVQSAQMKRDVAEAGIPPQMMTAIPMGIRPALFSPREEGATRRILSPHAPCIVYLGTLTRARQLDFLLRVLVQVRAAIPTALLYLVGRGDDPSDEEFLRSQIGLLGLDGAVIMTGQLPRAEALEFVAEADVCVSPFRPSPVLNSTSPTKLVEYMAMGKVVVANDHPEQRLVIEESGAGLCVPYEERAFAEAILKLLRDRVLAQEMGRRGRPYVLAHRSYAIIGERVEAQLRRIIEHARGGRR